MTRGSTSINLNDEKQLLNSHDLGLVAYLLCHPRKCELVGLDRSNGSRVVFILRKKDGLDETIQKYWNCKGLVDAQTYFNQMKRLKSQIHSQD